MVINNATIVYIVRLNLRSSCYSGDPSNLANWFGSEIKREREGEKEKEKERERLIFSFVKHD